MLCVWQSRSSGPHWLPQIVGEGWGDEGTIRFHSCGYLCRCGDRLLRPVGWCRMATHPVIHDNPDRRPNRIAFTLTGPSPILRCWFDKGTPLIAAKPLSWVSPCLTPCTPTRATRGEARGHRSVLAQNSLLMHPLLFPSFGLVVGLVCPRHMVDWS